MRAGHPISCDDLLFPGVLRENWQMMPWERIALTGVLSRLRPRLSLEVGVYYGGSLSLTSQYAERIVAIDIDEGVRGRFPLASNVELRIGNSLDLIPKFMREVESRGENLDFVLIDADHSAAGVKRDIELVLEYEPKGPLVIMMHDSGNPDCRRGILEANWAASLYCQFVECDFVPGQIIEHSVGSDGRGEIWGGFALAYLDGCKRSGDLEIRQSAKTSVRSIHSWSYGSG